MYLRVPKLPPSCLPLAPTFFPLILQENAPDNAAAGGTDSFGVSDYFIHFQQMKMNSLQVGRAATPTANDSVSKGNSTVNFQLAVGLRTALTSAELVLESFDIFRKWGAFLLHPEEFWEEKTADTQNTDSLGLGKYYEQVCQLFLLRNSRKWEVHSSTQSAEVVVAICVPCVPLMTTICMWNFCKQAAIPFHSKR